MYSLILKNIARHVQLTAEEETYFTSLLVAKRVRKKQFLIVAGEECRYEYFVNKGCLKQYYLDDKGQEHILSFAPEEWWISDMYGFINQQPALTTIEALEDTEVFAIEKSKFEELVQQIPCIERFFRIILQRALVSHQRRIIESMSLGSAGRYKNFVQQYPSLEQRLSQRQIAFYLGVTPESLSRMKAGLVKSH